MGINPNIINIVIFNIAWFLCVWGGNWVALVVFPAVMYIHFTYVASDRGEGWLLFKLTVIGLLVDASLLMSGLLVIPGHQYVAPFWLILLWPLFGTTLRHSLAWLRTRLPLAVILGAVGGTGSYYAGVALTKAEWGQVGVEPWLVMGVIWALLIPVALIMANQRVRVAQGQSA